MEDLPKKFRFGFQMLYLVICVFFVATVAVAATWGAFGGSADRQAAKAKDSVSGEVGPLDGPACAKGLRTLHDEMADRAFQGIQNADTNTALQAWRNWSVAWRERLKELRQRCVRPDNSAESLSKTVFRDVERLQRAYDTALTGFIELGKRPLSRIRPALLSP